MGVTLLAGAASVDITPDPVAGVYLAGFMPNRRATDAIEPIEASALVLRCGDAAVALVSVDATGLLRSTIERIRGQVTALPPGAVLVCATHTHAAPDTMGLWGKSLFGVIPYKSGVDQAWLDETCARIAGAVDAAAAATRPARIRAASFDAPTDLTRNDRKGGGRYDHAVALAVEAADGGERVATVLNYASHPEGLWEHNHRLSPDFVGAWRRGVKGAAGGEALYFSGPLGGMLTPDIPLELVGAEREAAVDAVGARLAALTTDALARAGAIEADALVHHRRVVDLPNRNWRFRLMFRLGVLQVARAGDGVATEIHRLRFGDLEIASMPGEPTPEVGALLREQLTASHRMVLGLCGDELGYILLPTMFDDREYAYEQTMSLGRRTAPLLLEAHAALAGAPS